MSVSFAAARLKKKKAPGLNLVALMDIFTVLVFFLMFNLHDEQAINLGKEVAQLPASVLAVDNLKASTKVDVLEIPNAQTVYFNGQALAVDETLEQVASGIAAACQTASAKGCHILALEAPPTMPYPDVDRFVKLGKHLKFDDIYLVVTQK